jgi:predicted metallopeptidase
MICPSKCRDDGYCMRRKNINKEMVWVKAPDVRKRISSIKKELNLDWIKLSRLFIYRSHYSTARAYARTWGFPRIWQMSLKEDPAYVIEVLSEQFDKLSTREQDKVLVHELAHIPKNFSGSLLAHVRKRGKRNFHGRVELLINSLFKDRST